MELVGWGMGSNAVRHLFNPQLDVALTEIVCGDVQNVIDSAATLQLETDCNMAC